MTEIVRGARAIGGVIGLTARAAYHLLERGELPANKHNGQWVASRDRLVAAVLDQRNTDPSVVGKEAAD